MYLMQYLNTVAFDNFVSLKNSFYERVTTFFELKFNNWKFAFVELTLPCILKHYVIFYYFIPRYTRSKYNFNFLTFPQILKN